MGTPKKNAAKTKAAKSEKLPVTELEEKKEVTTDKIKPEVITHVVTEQDVINNPDAGLEEGDKIDLPENTEKEVKNYSSEEEPDTSKEPNTQLSYSEAELIMNDGAGIKLPNWLGFWFKDVDTDKVYILTKDNEILDNPEEEHKSSNEWMLAEPTMEQEAEVLSFILDLKEVKEEPLQVSELTAVAFNRTKGGTFQKFKKEISFEKLSKREGLPPEVNRDSQILLSDGSVYDYEKQQITQQKATI